MSPLWQGPGNTHGFVLVAQSYRAGWAAAQTPKELAVPGVRRTTSVLSNLTGAACDRWSLVTD